MSVILLLLQLHLVVLGDELSNAPELKILIII